MKTESEVRDAIKRTEEGYKHVLDQHCAAVQINAAVALMQTEACARLEALYGVLGEARPRFKCDSTAKADPLRN